MFSDLFATFFKKKWGYKARSSHLKFNLQLRLKSGIQELKLTLRQSKSLALFWFFLLQLLNGAGIKGAYRRPNNCAIISKNQKLKTCKQRSCQIIISNKQNNTTKQNKHNEPIDHFCVSIFVFFLEHAWNFRGVDSVGEISIVSLWEGDQSNSINQKWCKMISEAESAAPNLASRSIN